MAKFAYSFARRGVPGTFVRPDGQHITFTRTNQYVTEDERDQDYLEEFVKSKVLTKKPWKTPAPTESAK